MIENCWTLTFGKLGSARGIGSKGMALAALYGLEASCTDLLLLPNVWRAIRLLTSGMSTLGVLENNVHMSGQCQQIHSHCTPLHIIIKIMKYVGKSKRQYVRNEYISYIANWLQSLYYDVLKVVLPTLKMAM